MRIIDYPKINKKLQKKNKKNSKLKIYLDNIENIFSCIIHTVYRGP